MSSIAQRAGISALQDTEYEKRTRQLIEKERRYLIQEFLKMGCTVFPSEADYITFRLPQEKTGFLLKERLLEGKITDSLLCKLQEYAAGLLPHCGKTACR